MNNARKQFRPAFTLIELILALGMVGILAVSLYTSMKIAFKATAAADSAIEPSRTADLAMELIAQDLQNTILPNTTITNAVNTTSTLADSSSGTTGTTASTPAAKGGGGANSSSSSSSNADTGYVLAGDFEGTQSQGSNGQEADDLQLYTLSNGPQHQDGDGEIKFVELTVAVPTPQTNAQGVTTQVAPEDQVPCLIRNVTSDLTTEQSITPDQEILCRNVVSLTLQYFDGSNWNATWDSTQEDNTLPAAVQVTLVLSRPTPTGGTRNLTYTRIFALACSGAALDTNVNTGSSY